MTTPSSRSARPRALGAFSAAGVLLLAALAWWSQHELALRSALAGATTERDLARLETRGLRNELAAERLLAAQERATAHPFADATAHWLTPVANATTAPLSANAHGLVLLSPSARTGLLLLDRLPSPSAGEVYALFAGAPSSATDTDPGVQVAEVPLPAAGASVRVAFTLPAEISTDSSRFTLARRSSAGVVTVLATGRD